MNNEELKKLTERLSIAVHLIVYGICGLGVIVSFMIFAQNGYVK